MPWCGSRKSWSDLIWDGNFWKKLTGYVVKIAHNPIGEKLNDIRMVPQNEIANKNQEVFQHGNQ